MRELIGIAEILVSVGLAVMGFGLWMTVGYWALVTVGVVMTGLGLFLASRGL